jgi:hypothetical protein
MRSTFFNLGRLARTCAVPLVTVFAFVHSASRAQPNEDDLRASMRNMYSKGEPSPDYWPQITEKLEAKDYAGASKLADEAIGRKPDEANLQLDAWKRSQAFLLRSRARQGLGLSQSKVFADIVASARLGNLDAVRFLVSDYVDVVKKGGASDGRTPDGTDMGEILQVGVDLGDRIALKAVADGFGGARFSPSQRRLVSLLAKLKEEDSGYVTAVAAASRESDFSAALRDFALVGGPFAADGAKPGRDVLATLMAERTLRDQLAMDLGFAQRRVRPPREATLREIMEVHNWTMEFSGMGTLYNLVPEAAGFGRREIVMTKEELGRAMMPGDIIHVRCGPIAHTAWVFKVDPASDELVLIDPLFQFWQPSHNGCIKQFATFHYKYGYYNARLRLSEVLAILDAIQTIRSYEVPAFVGWAGISREDWRKTSLKIRQQVNAACRTSSDASLIGSPLSSALRTDLFTFFNFGAHDAPPSYGSLDAKVYLPNAVEFRGDVVLAMRVDGNQCIQGASLFLARRFMEGSKSSMAQDLLKSFLKQAGRAGQNSDVTRDSDVQQLASVLGGTLDHTQLDAEGLTLLVANVASETGARWIRFDVW